jgi:hypothetical protein
VVVFGTDFAETHGLWTLLNTVRQLEEGISDTEMTAGSEVYQAALVFYKSLKMAVAPAKPNSPCRAGKGTARIQSPDRSIRNRMDSPKSPDDLVQSRTERVLLGRELPELGTRSIRLGGELLPL